ncbi:unnamed protein product [Pieris macdunnoughi]|uniref:Uncharacterized protein n=1 Tax=Pieris macdunnoughi TaxID=345717 RepID=A0A821XSH0_9NEOP|nr:unnamed protein product [Pieris macdunnoughi]
MKKYSTMDLKVSAEEGIGNQAHVNEVSETPESQLDGGQVTLTQEFRNPASAATKFKKAKKKKPTKNSATELGEALNAVESNQIKEAPAEQGGASVTHVYNLRGSY